MFVERGEISVKGKGKMNTYFVSYKCYDKISLESTTTLYKNTEEYKGNISNAKKQITKSIYKYVFIFLTLKCPS